MRIRTLHHDGSIQIHTPKEASTDKSHFNGDCAGLVHTVCRKAFPSTRQSDMPNGKLYVKYDVL